MTKKTTKTSRTSPKAKGKKTAPRAVTTTATPRQRDPRLPAVGTPITVERSGKTYTAIERADGSFEFNGKPYKTLSTIAKEVLGCCANGFLFFHLTDAQTSKVAAASKAKTAKPSAGRRAPKTPAKGSEMVPVGKRAKKSIEGVAAAKLDDLGTEAGQRAALRAAGIVNQRNAPVGK